MSSLFFGIVFKVRHGLTQHCNSVRRCRLDVYSLAILSLRPTHIVVIDRNRSAK